MEMDMKEIAKIVFDHGGRLYLVGGAVRDIALGKKPKDFDYCVTGISQEEWEKLFPESFLRGKDFPVFDLNEHTASTRSFSPSTKWARL